MTRGSEQQKSTRRFGVGRFCFPLFVVLLAIGPLAPLGWTATPKTLVYCPEVNPATLSPALAVETHENWLEAHRYLNMDYLRELKKEAVRKAV